MTPIGSTAAHSYRRRPYKLVKHFEGFPVALALTENERSVLDREKGERGEIIQSIKNRLKILNKNPSDRQAKISPSTGLVL